MPKKSFKGISPDNPALPYFSPQDGQDSHIVQDGQDRSNGQQDSGDRVVHSGHVDHDSSNVHNVQYGQDRPHGQSPTDKTSKCHINLRVSQELKDYLTDASWRERKNITQYLTDLIEADMKAKQAKEGEKNEI